MRDTIVIIGEGQLAELVNRQLEGSVSLVWRRDIPWNLPKSAKLCVTIGEEYRPDELEAAERKVRQFGIPWLSGRIVSGEGVVGPLARPDLPGCLSCAMTRIWNAGFDQDNRMALQLELMRKGVIRRNRSVSRNGLVLMSRLIAEVARRGLQGKPSGGEDAVYIVDFATLGVTRHAFLPDPLCSVCGEVPDDTSEAARILLKPNPKTDPGSYRAKPIEPLKQAMHRDYVDERTGLMKKLTPDPDTPFSDVYVNVPTPAGVEVTVGRSHHYKQSELTAILEGLERICGTMPRGKRTCILDSYERLRDVALDPRTAGLYSDEQYAMPDFPFEPFDPTMKLRWVLAYSFLQERPVLVPEQFVYYSSGIGGSFVDEGSNGCALGGSLEEAILYGLLELAERDAFLLSWYARLPLPRLDPGSVPDTELQLMVQRMEKVAGYRLFLLNGTMEHGIPSIIAVAKNTKKTGANLICAAGAHLDPIRAAKSAIFELAGHTHYLDALLEQNREEYAEMAENPDLVSEMPDHALSYTVPEAEARVSFWLDPERPVQRFSDVFAPRERRTDVTDDLRDSIERFRRLNMDVLAVDQSTVETRRNGLFCAKVIVPGLLPMTFGHQLRRVSGLERVLKVPMELGYRDRPLTPSELNPYPHPFL
ncbi:TOMM precursor leader peptide-binding protein [Cohnella candidum]|uniref:Bacteriocin biosynthesis protein SagD n=1 Tax=Cohnella candidum TaxID=2674991 RepID=A0A3G3JXK7_9BACL|nr:TOMM precursor leader peptide-binding protein [Cohnella candidum]AYQ72976.1 bacteriocin biosynthesis protein SagD [Cohnella candidum]